MFQIANFFNNLSSEFIKGFIYGSVITLFIAIIFVITTNLRFINNLKQLNNMYVAKNYDQFLNNDEENI